MTSRIDELIRKSIEDEKYIDNKTIPRIVFRSLRKTELPLYVERGYIFPPCDECTEEYEPILEHKYEDDDRPFEYEYEDDDRPLEHEHEEDKPALEPEYEEECLRKKSKNPCHKCYTIPQIKHLKSQNKDCCLKSISEHISSGSKSKIKSKYISLTQKLSIACTYNSKSYKILERKNENANVNKKSFKFNNITLNSPNKNSIQTHSGIIAVIDTNGLNIINPLNCYDTSKQEPTYIQFAKASYELLVPNKIKFSNIITFVKSVKVKQEIFETMTEGTDCIAKIFVPKSRRKKEQANQWFIITKLDLTQTHKDLLKNHAKLGLYKRFISTKPTESIQQYPIMRTPKDLFKIHANSGLGKRFNRSSHLGSKPKTKSAKRPKIPSTNTIQSIKRNTITTQNNVFSNNTKSNHSSSHQGSKPKTKRSKRYNTQSTEN